MTKKILLSLLLISIGANVTLAFLVMDRSLALADARHSTNAYEQQIVPLEKLLTVVFRGRPRGEVLTVLKAIESSGPEQAVVSERDGDVWLNEIRFHMENGVLKDVRH